MKSLKHLILIASFGLAPVLTMAETTATEKVGQVAEDVADATKKGVRKMKDATCEMINGKMECAGKKVKHKAENAMDKVSNKAGEVKDKVDTN